MQGMVNYYSFASNVQKLEILYKYLERSCAYTLSEKYKKSTREIYKKFGKRLRDPESDKELKILNIHVPAKFDEGRRYNPSETGEVR